MASRFWGDLVASVWRGGGGLLVAGVGQQTEAVGMVAWWRQTAGGRAIVLIRVDGGRWC